MAAKKKTKAAAALMPSEKDVAQLVGPAEEYATDLGPALKAFEVTSQKRLDKAGAVLKEVKGLHNELETSRKSVTQPLLAAKRTVDSWFSPTTKKLSVVESALKAAVAGYLDTQATARDEALEDGDTSVEEPVLPAGVSAARKTYNELEDFSQVPDEYLKSEYDCIDWDKVALAVKTGKKVPGIKMAVKHSIRVSS